MKLFLFLGIILIIDVATSMQGFRKYLMTTEEEFFMPNDILAELGIAFGLCFMYLLSRISFKAYKEKTGHNTMSWEASDHRPNFRTFSNSRGYLLNEFESSGFNALVERFAQYLN